jgi:hypothetical protein
MEAHKLLKDAGLQVSPDGHRAESTLVLRSVTQCNGVFWSAHPRCLQKVQVQSFGVNTRVKLPGESQDSPNHYGA